MEDEEMRHGTIPWIRGRPEQTSSSAALHPLVVPRRSIWTSHTLSRSEVLSTILIETTSDL